MNQLKVGAGHYVAAIAAVFAIEQLVETVTIVGGSGQFISPGGAMNYDLGGTLFIVFFVALGLSLSLWHGGAAGADRSELRKSDF